MNRHLWNTAHVALTLLAAIIAGCQVASQSTATGLPPHLQRLRDGLRDDFKVETLEDAKAVHASAMWRARRIMSHFGHQPVAPLGHSPASSRNSFATPAIPPPSNAKPPVIYPTDFGADPTGRNDSTDAFNKAVAALLSVKTTGSGRMMAANITDLGGAILDLDGGDYLISQPVAIPPLYGNVHIVRGTLRASQTFPKDKFLVMIGDDSCKPKVQGSCNEFVEVSEMLFDASHVAAGGVYIATTMGATVGPSCFFTRFEQQGLRIDDGHEVMVLESWFAQYYWSDKHPDPSQLSSIGIQINGNDHFVTNVIVFDFTKVGVELNGAANLLTGVHTWNGGGVGIRVNAQRNRLVACYLDYNYLELVDPEEVVVESTFFLATNARLRAVKGTTHGLRMRLNDFTQSPSVQLNGTFHEAKNTIIADNINGDKSTRATQSLTQKNSKVFTFDFTSQLLFSWIDNVQYSFMSNDSNIVPSVARPPTGTKVSVEFSEAVTGTVTLTAYQAV